MYNHTRHMSEASEEHQYVLMPYAFDFLEMPSAFSSTMVMAEAAFVRDAILLIMSNVMYQGHPFHIIGHSMGGFVNYQAVQMPNFPVANLRTIITLSSPLDQAAQFFNSEIFDLHRATIHSKIPGDQVLHLNMHGGTRDILVLPENSHTSRYNFASNASLYVLTENMRNVYKTIDHNSPYYFKPFLDAFVPSLLQLMTSSLDIN